ncbi:hypothetical protein [Beijerinckia indica]|uniref:hypothetical protein n=1 Tax=Beijerinckia indica TaxID=533 RepID=UPI0011D1003E|nr:hypothetical protein [Beijerinckia indica]
MDMDHERRRGRQFFRVHRRRDDARDLDGLACAEVGEQGARHRQPEAPGHHRPEILQLCLGALKYGSASPIDMRLGAPADAADRGVMVEGDRSIHRAKPPSIVRLEPVMYPASSPAR